MGTINAELLSQGEATQIQYIFCFVLINFLFLITAINKSNNKRPVFIWISIILYCLFAFWDTDYFTFRNSFYTSLEDFRDPLYYYISFVSFNSYTFFRLIIWGTALLLFYKAFKQFKVHTNTILFIFVVSYLLLFSQVRASLGLSMYFYGLTLILNNKKKNTLKYFYGIMLICCSYLGHRSMILPIVLTPFIFIKYNRKRVLIIVLAGFAAGNFVSALLASVASGGIDAYVMSGLSGASDALETYASMEAIVTYNWKFLLTRFLRKHIFTTLFAYCAWMCFFSRWRFKITDEVKRMMFMSSTLFSVAMCFSLVDGLGASILGNRFMFMLGIPLCITLTKIKDLGVCKPIMFYIVLLPGFLFAEIFILGKILSF